MLHNESDSDDSFSDGDDDDDTNASSQAPTTANGEQKTDQSSSVIVLPSDGKIVSNTNSEGVEQEASKIESEEAGTEVQEDSDKGDPEMAPVYLKRLLPVFIELFHSSLAPPLR